MQYLYLDESGDLGFDFITKKPSKFFTITVLSICGQENNRRLSKAVNVTIRRKCSKSTLELKGANTEIDIKKYMFTRMTGIEFSLYSIILNKIRVNKELTIAKDRLYNFVANLLIEKVEINDAEDRINLVVDKSKSKKEIVDFNRYIVQKIKGRVSLSTPLDINHQLSHETPGLQAVDMFAWGFFRKNERKDSEWYDVFKGRIKFETVYLPPK